MTSVLIYGYGNPGRCDDGLGIEVSRRIIPCIPPGARVTVDCNYQLNAEDALTVSRHDVVIFADASAAECEPFRFYRLDPDASIGFTTHAMSAGSVLALARELYNAAAEAYMLEIKGYDWAISEGLSARAENNCAAAVAFLRPLVANPVKSRFATATAFERAGKLQS